MKRRPAIALLMASSLCLFAEQATGQSTLMIERPSGELGIDFDGSWIDFAQSGGTARRTLEEWVRLRMAGTLFHPRFLNIDLGLRPTWAQTNWTGVPVSSNGGVNRLNGFAALSFLSGSPLSLTATGVRTTETNRGRFGDEARLSLFDWGVNLRYKNAYLPIYIDYRDRTRDLNWRSTPQQLRREDDRIQTLQLVAQNSKMRALAQRLSLDDRVDERDFTTDQANLDHRLRWGKRSSLVSAFRYLDREGFAAYDLLNWTQQVHLQHTWKISSTYNYRLFSQTAGGVGASGWGGRIRGAYKILPSLELSADAYGESTRFSAGRQSVYRLRPFVGFGAPLPLGAHVRVGASVGYESLKVEPTDDGFANVLNELHVVDQSGRFQLDEAYPETSSIVITDADETAIYEDGIDYRVAESFPFAEVLVLPSGRIQVGDTLLVDYRYRILPESTSKAILSEYGVDLRIGILSLYHRRIVRDGLGDPQANRLRMVVDYDDTSTGFALSMNTPAGVLSLLGELRRRESDVSAVNSYLARAGLRFGIVRDVHSAIEARLHSRRGDTADFDLVSGEWSFEWDVTRALRLRADLSGYNWNETVRVERFLGGGIGADYRLGLFRMAARYDRLSWIDGFDRDEDRLVARITRSF